MRICENAVPVVAIILIILLGASIRAGPLDGLPDRKVGSDGRQERPKGTATPNGAPQTKPRSENSIESNNPALAGDICFMLSAGPGRASFEPPVG